MIEEEIINDVVYNLKRLTNLESISFKAVYRQQYDYDLTINGVTFACEVKTHLNKANCNLRSTEVKKFEGTNRQVADSGCKLCFSRNVRQPAPRRY